MEWDQSDDTSQFLITSLPPVENEFSSWQEHIHWYYSHHQGNVLIQSPYHFNNFMDPLFKVAEHWSLPYRQLYTICAYVFVMSKLNVIFVEGESNPSLHIYPHTIQRIMYICENNVSLLIDNMSESSGFSILFGAESPIWAILWAVHEEFVRVATDVRIPPFFSQVYQQLWMMLWRDSSDAFVKEKVTQELKRIETAYTVWRTNELALNEAFVGTLALLYVVQHEDVQARALLEEFPEIAVLPSIWLAMQVIQSSGDWNRRLLWLRLVSRHLVGIRYHREIVRDYAELWIEAVTELPDLVEECQSFLAAHLPMTNGYLETLLLRTGNYRGWVEVQLVEQLDPLYLPVATFKPIEKADRELLLPIYHQAVERYVQNKNRDAYKRAVRLLVKLASHYKKLKQIAIWDEFLQQFLARHSRLRALHEEMRKKGLIT